MNEYRINMYNSNRTQHIKEGAFLDYFRYFATNALETTRKLENKFQDEFSDDIICNSPLMYKLIKKLLGAYEVLILEINDSCEFVEIPEFGTCIVKMFFQLMAIIKFLARNMSKVVPQERIEREKKHCEQRYTMLIPNNSAPYPGLAENTEKQNIRIRENASYIFKDLNQQVKTLERENRNNIEENENALERISRGRERLESIECSQSEAVLAETVTMLFTRGELINNFVNVLKSTQIQNKEAEPEPYSQLKEKIEEDNIGKMETARTKLTELLKAYSADQESKKKKMMISEEVQATFEETEADDIVKKRRSHYKRANVEQTKKLRQDILTLEEQNKSLKVYIKNKNQEYQNEATQTRAENIILMSKLSASQSKGGMKNKWALESKDEESKQDSGASVDRNGEAKLSISIDSDSKGAEFASSFRNTGRLNRIKIAKPVKSRVKFSPQEDEKFHIFSNLVQEVYQPVKVKQHSQQKVKSSMKRIKIKNTITGDEFDHSSPDKPLMSKKSIESHCQSSKKISSRTISNSHERERPVSSKKEVYPSKSRKLISYQFSDIEVSEPVPKPEKERKHHELLKKESIIQFIQESQRNKKTKLQHNTNTNTKTKAEYFKDNLKKQQNCPLSAKNEPQKDHRPSSTTVQVQKLEVPIEQSTRVQTHSFSFAFKNIKLPVQFTKLDLTSIFITEGNAKNYEILNLTLAAKTKKYTSLLGGKAHAKGIKSQSNQIVRHEFLTATESIKPNEVSSILINAIFEVMSVLKKDKPNYRRLCNFIRYPHSSVFTSASSAWESFQHEETNIEIIELRKLIIRFSKFHVECGEPLCQHWTYFLSKLGINLK